MKIKILLPLVITIMLSLQFGMEVTAEYLHDDLHHKQLLAEKNNATG